MAGLLCIRFRKLRDALNQRFILSSFPRRREPKNMDPRLRGDVIGCADYTFSTWPNSSSTGVARPKMVTDTRTLDFS